MILVLWAGEVGRAQQPTGTTRTSNAIPQSKNSSSLALIGEKMLVLDPACNACMGASLPLNLQYPVSPRANATAISFNLAPSSSTPGEVRTLASVPLKIQLHADHLISDSRSDVAAGVETTIGPMSPNTSLPAEIKPGESVPIIVRVKGILPVGRWKSTIYNGDANLGEVSIVAPEVSFRIGFDRGTNNDGKTPTLMVTRGEKASILVKNEDAVGYWFNWVFRVDDKQRAAILTHKDNVRDPDAKIAAGGQTLLDFEPDPSWFEESGNSACSWPTAWMEYFKIPCNWRAVFKDKEAEALLTVQLASPNCKNDTGATIRLLRIPVELAYYNPNKKSFWSYFAILILLLSGALFSLYVNYKFPDEQIRSDLREQLATNGKAIADLSMTLASRLRVLVGIENRLLTTKLKSLKWYSTEFEKQRSEVAECTSRLAKRVDQLRRMGRLREDYELLTTNEVPPTLLAKLEDSFEQLGRMVDDLRVSDSDLQDAEIKMKELQQTITNWKQPDSIIVAELLDLLKSLYDDFRGTTGMAPGAQQADAVGPAPGGVLTGSSTLKQLLSAPPEVPLYPSVRKLIEELVADVPAASQITISSYYRKGLAAYRGDTLRRYIVLCDTQNPDENSPIVLRRKELIALLVTESWYGQRKGRRLVWEMSEGIYEDDIKKEIEAKRVEISLDRNLLRAFEPALFNIRFSAAKFDTCSAREEWCSTINFGHGPFEDQSDPRTFLEEKGWSVAHYFQSEGWYTLKSSFRRNETTDPVCAVGQVTKQIFVGPSQDEMVITGSWIWIRRPWRKFTRWFQVNGNSVLRLLLALIPAVLGLVAGAKDQLLKMDLFLALSAIFVLGFSSDQVKNLLSQKPKS
jgi:hypothetical protein